VIVAVGIDTGLVATGIAVIRDGVAKTRCTINVEGDVSDTGPRYVKLREGLETVAVRILRRVIPAVVAIEQPELGIRKGHDAGNVMKLYGAFAVTYSECARLWKKAHIMGVPADTVTKSLRARIMRAKYRVEFQDSHQADALWLADYAWDVARARQRAEERAAEMA
jgi:Holliday junction resolvasome RuvABC endonuclease subunit